MNSGQSALDKIKNIGDQNQQKPSLILLDLMLPDINGLEVLKQLRQNPLTKDIAVFILSNFTISDAQKGEPIQPDKYIMKSSITPTQLIEIINTQIKK